jgi:hypothetical protein
MLCGVLVGLGLGLEWAWQTLSRLKRNERPSAAWVKLAMCLEFGMKALRGEGTRKECELAIRYAPEKARNFIRRCGKVLAVADLVVTTVLGSSIQSLATYVQLRSRTPVVGVYYWNTRLETHTVRLEATLKTFGPMCADIGGSSSSP